jgi:hypothetical protein
MAAASNCLELKFCTEQQFPSCHSTFGGSMSQYHNNNLVHNLRVGVRMVQEGMHPDVASYALAKEGINAPAPLLEAAAQPGVLESMGAKPFTHARADKQIASIKVMQAHLAEIQAQSKLDEDDISFMHDEVHEIDE